MRQTTQHFTHLSTMPYHEKDRIKEENSTVHGKTSLRETVINYYFILEEHRPSHFLKFSTIQNLFSIL